MVGKLYEVLAQPEAVELRQDLTPSRLARAEKSLKGSEKPLKFLEETEDLIPMGA